MRSSAARLDGFTEKASITDPRCSERFEMGHLRREGEAHRGFQRVPDEMEEVPMYDARKARLEELKSHFEREFDAHSPKVHETGKEYLAGLAEFLATVDRGPVADPQIAHEDTTGTVERTGEYTDWVAEEHIRVRRALHELA
ncbi:MAG: hypothetical protein H0X52_02285 [Gemmatimonadetes bacterium]|nr:hypothetical protein [Gemmatimonadota bacterium]MDQ3521627.1 hypothetical protein [Gemmatimonadota bacterium]